ncbi:ferric-chelate reductase [Trichophyton tonsurans CBS 112818]|uniref:ferric-chelate reductase (NADPH) n=1 Tax=Trichophyton tonsurans (strain CBS 112818) TaxID=647933 RepID=F2RNC3_TRIT1|nr:ferric-chelate reductase [Trichophyton tonsurans CBS 112818]
MQHHIAHKPKPTGFPWMSTPLLLHSSRKDKCKLTPAQCEFRSGYWVYWYGYTSDLVYARASVYFMCAVISAFMLAFIIRKFTARSFVDNFLQKARGLVRYCVYRGFRIPFLAWLSPNVGRMLVISTGILFFSRPKPYYWPNTKEVVFGSSPPLAIRAGWIALGLLPFVIALASKANWIAALTGTSHEKIQIFHQWASWAMFVLGLVHICPIIIYHVQRGDMQQKWKTSMHYWTGVVTIIVQAYLTWFSVPIIRKRFYEFFKATHFFAAIVYVIFLFIHCDFRLTSWDYFIATAVVYLPCLLFVQIRTLFINRLCLATVDVLPCGLIRVTTTCSISWKPGQHIFLRFLGLGAHCLTTHPFTIASLPQAESSNKTNEMTLYVKPYEGITQTLSDSARDVSSLKLRVLLEGPYGGISFGSMSRFDSILIITGGSGASFSFPVVEDVLRSCATEDSADQVKGKTLNIIYAARSSLMAQWYEEKIRTLVSCYPSSSIVSVSIHTTSITSPLQSNVSLAKEYASSWMDQSFNGGKGSIIHGHGRPCLANAVASLVEQATGKSAGIVVCGPPSMLHDIRNVAAEAQRKVIAGEVKEIYLHTECFS